MSASSHPFLIRQSVAIGAAIFAIATTAVACGLEDPSSIVLRRGVLNLAYPEALHVGTAAWQAQLAGRLPRDPLAQREDLTPEARGALRLVRATSLLRQFAATLPKSGTGSMRSGLAVVLLGPVLWSRLQVDDATVNVLPHIAGPEPDDVVVVTDIAVVEAIAAGTLRMGDALSVGLMRLYGPADDVAAAQRWLTRRAHG